MRPGQLPMRAIARETNAPCVSVTRLRKEPGAEKADIAAISRAGISDADQIR